MGGGLMQLVAYGAQDVYLTGNPQITFFKVVYRRHTNFSMELIKQTLNGDLSNGQSDSASCTISRNGDLVHDMYIQIHGARKQPDENTGVTGKVFQNLVNKTHRSIKEVSIEIGGQLIDRQSGEFMQLYSDLVESNPSGNPSGVNKFDRLSGNGWTPKWDKYNTGSPKRQFSYYVPLRFWFCRNPGLALPLIALQYHEVRCNISIEKSQLDFNEASADLDLWANYIYLDTDERRRFAQVSHEYLIEQVQNTQQLMKDNITSVNLNFNHPVKELMWCFSSSNSNWHWPGIPFNTKQSRVVNSGKNNLTSKYDAVKIFQPNAGGPAESNTDLYFGNHSSLTLVDASSLHTKLILNGQDRFQERPLDYFSTTQIYKHHTGRGSCTSSNGTFCYSFALKPEEHQPSGTCNFSRIDSSILQIEGTDTNIADKTIKVYAINYNVLRVMSGMGGLAYSN
jgi:hypothetical protein